MDKTTVFPDNPFRIGLANQVHSRFKKPFAHLIERGIEQCTSLGRLAKEYDAHWQKEQCCVSAEALAAKCLNLFDTKWEVTKGSLDLIPKSGPVLIVANHPFGGMEGIVLIDFLATLRPDYKILANFLLNRVSEFSPRFIPVDPFESADSRHNNIRGVNRCLSLLKSGGLLATFPSGTVSHLSWKSREVSDPTWNKNIARFARKTGATVVPIYFHGRNSWLFQAAGLLHPLLRTALIPREFYRQQGHTIEVRIGAPITPQKFATFSNDQEITDYFRLRTYLLGQNESPTVPKRSPVVKLQPVIAAGNRSLLASEIATLPQTQQLHAHGKYEMYYGSATQLPNILREIGRLRELAFRAANEGTGKSIDIDVFDNFYQHLFVWDSEAREIVGAYRIAKADEVLARYGVKGLYTFSLFSYRRSVITQMGKALEVGRSFINPKYQRDFGALLRLWEGIGRYVGKHPEYKTLFGPVSISSDYNAVSRQLIVDFLQVHYHAVDIAREIRPRTPHTRLRIRGVDAQQVRVVKSLNDVNELVREVESRQAGLPVLLRQYLKLGARVIGYNIDPDFSNVLDALIYVDLTDTQPRLLERYLGTEFTRQFLALHQEKQQPEHKIVSE